MKLIITIVAIGFAQQYLGWGNWLWWLFGGVIFLIGIKSYFEEK